MTDPKKPEKPEKPEKPDEVPFMTFGAPIPEAPATPRPNPFADIDLCMKCRAALLLWFARHFGHPPTGPLPKAER